LLLQLRELCAEAEASGIQVLEDFAARLRSYRMAPVPITLRASRTSSGRKKNRRV
jgi:hypothetical protein